MISKLNRSPYNVFRGSNTIRLMNPIGCGKFGIHYGWFQSTEWLVWHYSVCVHTAADYDNQTYTYLVRVINQLVKA